VHRTVWYVQAPKTSTNSKKLGEKNVFNVKEMSDVVDDRAATYPEVKQRHARVLRCDDHARM